MKSWRDWIGGGGRAEVREWKDSVREEARSQIIRIQG